MSGIFPWYSSLRPVLPRVAVFVILGLEFACASPAADPSSPAAASKALPAAVERSGAGGGRHKPRTEPTAAPTPCVDSAVRSARYRCDLSQIEVTAQSLFEARKVRLSAEGERAIADVAELLERRQDLLLVRVEVYAAGDAPASSARRRALLDRSQARADLVLRELWRGHGVWAERLDAVGYGVERRARNTAARRDAEWHVRIVVTQRAP